MLHWATSGSASRLAMIPLGLSWLRLPEIDRSGCLHDPSQLLRDCRMFVRGTVPRRAIDRLGRDLSRLACADVGCQSPSSAGRTGQYELS